LRADAGPYPLIDSPATPGREAAPWSTRLWRIRRSLDRSRRPI